MKRIKILARKNLKMTPGKLAAQSVHAALSLVRYEELSPLQSVVVLGVSDAKFEEAKASHAVNVVVRDAGYTEVAPGTETVMAYLEDDPREKETN